MDTATLLRSPGRGLEPLGWSANLSSTRRLIAC
ncbi:hypothetical protein E2C01_101777 [Portunus trituberculatus]|uniref:Uncharacterized protein n=1 Tax=Portunus trituberculatus TaxID=210409 RepID=A0A5B7KFP7_PORTR|nr:hypothetical protein [Portunus trituberculatus]